MRRLDHSAGHLGLNAVLSRLSTPEMIAARGQISAGWLASNNLVQDAIRVIQDVQLSAGVLPERTDSGPG